MRAPPPAQQHPFPAQALQHSPSSPQLPLPQAVGLVMARLRRAEAELQTALPNPQGSGLLHSYSASQALNHFPLHYKKTFVFLHLHPPPSRTVAGFNHLTERMSASSEVSTVMSPLQHTHTCTRSDQWCAFHPWSSQNTSMPKTESQRERGSGSQAHLLTLRLSASCWWMPVYVTVDLWTSRRDNTVLTVASPTAPIKMFFFFHMIVWTRELNWHL